MGNNHKWFYATLTEGNRVMVMQFFSEKTRNIFFDTNKGRAGLERVDESNQYVRQALLMEENFPIIIYL